MVSEEHQETWVRVGDLLEGQVGMNYELGKKRFEEKKVGQTEARSTSSS